MNFDDLNLNGLASGNIDGLADKLKTTSGNTDVLEKAADGITDAIHQTSYITDIAVVRGKNAAAPAGYEKIDVDLNMKAGGSYLYLCVKRGQDKAQALTALAVVEGKNATAPVGFEKIDIDLNENAGGKYLYLCKKRGGGTPIEDIKVLFGDNDRISCPGYHRLERDLNEKAGGKYIYIFWR